MNLMLPSRQVLSPVLSPISLLVTATLSSTKSKFRHLKMKLPISLSIKESDSNNVAIGIHGPERVHDGPRKIEPFRVKLEVLVLDGPSRTIENDEPETNRIKN